MPDFTTGEETNSSRRKKTQGSRGELHDGRIKALILRLDQKEKGFKGAADKVLRIKESTRGVKYM